jgi:hypothetical protein
MTDHGFCSDQPASMPSLEPHARSRFCNPHRWRPTTHIHKEVHDVQT